MTKKKVLTIIVALSLIVVACLAFVGCESRGEDLQFVDKVVGRYADGFRTAKTFLAPDEAQQFVTEPRVSQDITIDTRVHGLHFVGIYLPKGEKLTITAPYEVAQQGHKIVINANSLAEETFDFDSVQKTVTTAVGGLVDLFISNAQNMQNNFNIVADGGVQMPYYRLGIDKKLAKTVDNGFVVLDASNIRFVMPSALVGLVSDIDKTLEWWRSTTEICDRMTLGEASAGAPLPTIVYAENIKGFELAQKDDATYKDIVKIDTNELGKMLCYSSLQEGSGWLLMQALGQLKINLAGGFGKGDTKTSMGYTVACLAYSIMTEADNAVNAQQQWMTTAYNCLTATKAKTLSKTDMWASFFLNLRYSFGAEKIFDIVQSYRDKVDSAGQIDNFYSMACDITQENLSQYFEFFGIDLSQKAKENFVAFAQYKPIQTKYTLGGVEKSADIGVKVPLGMTTKFDFGKDAVVSLFDGEITLSLKGSEGNWRDLDNGTFEYLPQSSRLNDTFTVSIVTGGHETTLFGKINVDIRYASHKVFEDVNARTVDKALSEVKTKQATFSTSLDKAESPNYHPIAGENSTSANKYNFSVTSGALQVKETGNYTFYLKSKGNCRVDFGVGKYKTEIFAVSLTVNEYTDELRYETKLDADKIYIFDIYVLNTNSDGYAKLGIKQDNGNISDVDNSLLVYVGQDRKNFVEFNAPVVDMQEFGVKKADFNAVQKEKWTIKSDGIEGQDNSALKNIIDTSLLTSFKSKFDANTFVFEIDFSISTVMDLLSLEVGQEMLNALCVVEGASSPNLYEEIDRFFLKDNKTNTKLKALTNVRYIKLTISNPKEKFFANIADFSVGKVVKESKIVPDTSSRIVYQGEWKRTYGYASVNGSVTENVDKNCAMIFSFYGSSFVMYALKAPKYGIADVYIDDKNNGTISFADVDVKSEQLVLEYNFEKEGLHTIKLVPHGSVDIINVDYITVIENEEQNVDKNFYNLWYLIIIPVVLLVALTICIIADIRVKKKRKLGESGACNQRK